MLKCNGYSIGLCTFSVLLCTDITLQRDYPFVFSLTVYKTPRFPPYEHMLDKFIFAKLVLSCIFLITSEIQHFFICI